MLKHITPAAAVAMSAPGTTWTSRSRHLTVIGAGPRITIIDGGSIDRVFDVGDATVDIFGVTIRNGVVRYRCV